MKLKSKLFSFDVRGKTTKELIVSLISNLKKDRIMMILLKIKSKLLPFLAKINQKNLNRGMAQFDKGMSIFNKALNDFGSAMDSMTKEFSTTENSNKQSDFEGKKNKENLKKLLGNSTKNQTPLWSEKKSSKLSNQIPIWSD